MSQAIYNLIMQFYHEAEIIHINLINYVNYNKYINRVIAEIDIIRINLEFKIIKNKCTIQTLLLGFFKILF